MQRIAEGNPGKIDLRFVDRDVHRDLTDRVRINGGDRVPVALFLAEDHELCAIFGDRTLQRYRALAARQLGPSCPTGIVAPDKDEMAATLQDWLDEVERVQLMLRLSARLRQKHQRLAVQPRQSRLTGTVAEIPSSAGGLSGAAFARLADNTSHQGAPRRNIASFSQIAPSSHFVKVRRSDIPEPRFS